MTSHSTRRQGASFPSPCAGASTRGLDLLDKVARVRASCKGVVKRQQRALEFIPVFDIRDGGASLAEIVNGLTISIPSGLPPPLDDFVDGSAKKITGRFREGLPPRLVAHQSQGGQAVARRCDVFRDLVELHANDVDRGVFASVDNAGLKRHV